MYVSLSNLPSPPAKYQKTIRSFHGGVNTSKIPSEIEDHQCAYMRNLLWENGVLRARRGLEGFGNLPTDYADAVPIAMYERMWKDHIVIAARLEQFIVFFGVDSDENFREAKAEVNLAEEVDSGSFFEFGEALYFKAKNYFVKIEYDGENFTAKNIDAYIPVTYINLNSNGVGDLYQPVNRLNSWREVWYTIDDAIEYAEIACDGQTKTFYLPRRCERPEQPQDGDLKQIVEVYLGARLLKEGASNGDYSVNLVSGSITIIGDTPPIGLKLSVKMLLYSTSYLLPGDEKAIKDALNNSKPHMKVYVKNLESGQYEEYRFSSELGEGRFGYSDGAVLFASNVGGDKAYKYDTNVRSRGIKIQYEVESSEQMQTITQCDTVTTYGASGIETTCVVMAGAEKQPNAFFWSGNDGNGANPTYFPAENYNLAGISSDPITAFGRQQDRLVIFQKNRISAATFGMAEVNGRATVTLNTKTINENIGCDCPGSVQLIENNLVWAHSKHGVLYLKDSTYAYETLVVCISGNVNEDSKCNSGKGLLSSFSKNDQPRVVSSFDDGNRYWLCLGNTAFIWDYSIQGYTANTEKLCWFIAEGVGALCWATGSARSEIFGLNNKNDELKMLCRFGERYVDLGLSYVRQLWTKSFDFGIYSNEKNIETVILNMDCSERMQTRISYITDRGTTRDRTKIDSEYETYEAQGDYKVFTKVRKPKCKRVREFGVFMSDEEADSAFSLISMQIIYTVNGRSLKAGKYL